MINSLKNVFPHLEEEECLIVKEDDFQFIDDIEGKKAYIIESNGQFKVTNPNNKEISFLAVDDCLFDSSDSSRADCIIFDNDTLCFVELKSCKNKNISDNRRSAKKQLIALIEFFQDKIPLDKKLEAYICVTCSMGKDDRVTMTPRANNEEAQTEFEEYYDTALFYKCQKEFT